jgi:23S rRNA (guanine745-N1)-methyltransferase
MNIVKSPGLACPIDGKPLQCREKQFICEHGHVYDIARQGYVNLLPVQHKRTREPGDSKAMVIARTQFLQSGIYQPIAATLAQIVSEHLTTDQDYCLMDAGCGEGYYFDFIAGVLERLPGDGHLSFIGLDISKPAIIEAAKKNKHIRWIVGTNRQPPVAQHSVDIIICVFGFHSFEGFDQALKPGGMIILVEPGTDHLKELREIIYKELKKNAPRDISATTPAVFSPIGTQSLQFRTGEIDNEQIHNLLVMTPHLYRATKEGKEAAASLQTLELTVDVVFTLLKKDD